MDLRIEAAEPEIRAFSSPAKWRVWLANNYTRHEGLWLRIYKKASGVTTVTYAEALDEALCFGWIDGQMKSYDAESYIQRFTPRRAKSIWSKINRDNIARLEAAGKMHQAGRQAVEAAKADGRWDAAYDPSSSIAIPDDFQKALDANQQAKTFYESLNKANTYAILWRIQTAKKPETRQKRINDILAKLVKGEKYHP